MFYVSQAYERVWGRTCASLYAAPKSWMDAVYQEDKDHVFAAIARHPSAEPHDMTYRIMRSDGAVRWIRDRGFPVRDESGVIVRFAGLAEDITESKNAEEALRAREQDLAEAQRIAKIGTWRFDPGRDFVTWSAELYRIFEIAKSDLNDYRSFLDRVHPEDKELVFQTSSRARESGTEWEAGCPWIDSNRGSEP